MRKQIRYLVLLSVLTLLPTIAAAEYDQFSVSVGVGNTQFQLNQPGIVNSYIGLSGSSEFNDSATAFSLYGAMQLDEYLSLETDLLIAGDITVRESGQVYKLFDVSSFAVTVALAKPVGERTRIFARLGTHFWDISQSWGDFITINNAVDLTYGIGMDVNLYGDRSRQLRIQWNHYEYDGVFITDSDTLTANILFMFGG